MFEFKVNYASNFIEVPCKASFPQIFVLILWDKKNIIKTVLAFLDFCTLETFNDGTVTYYINGAKKMWSMNWVGKQRVVAGPGSW